MPLPSDAFPIDQPRALLEALPVPAWLVNGRGAITVANAAWQTLAGDLIGANWLAAVDPIDASRAREAWLGAVTTGAPWQVDVRVAAASGATRWCRIQARPAGSAAGAPWCFTLTDIDGLVADRIEMTRRASLRDDMLDVSVDCIKIIDTAGRLIHINRSGCAALGLVSSEAGAGRPWLELLPASVRARGQRALIRARGGKPGRFAGKSVVPGRKPQFWDNILTPVLDADGAVEAILCVSRDVTAEHSARERLRAASELDSLTELLNRRSLKARLNRAVGRARQAGSRLGLLLIDLDHFKNVNDTLGHGAGDHLLRVLSRRLKTRLPTSTTVGRLGGDEFAVLIEDLDDEAELIVIAEQVLHQVAEPIRHSGRVINGGMSIGGALFPRDAWDASGLMACADTALNDLKNGGRGGVRIFCEQMTRAARDTASQLSLARQVIRDRAVEPHYQPKVRLEDGSIIGFEALLRWRAADGGLYLPGAVLEAFKDYELATGLAALMHDGVLADLARWRDAGLPLLPVSLNAAPVEFLRDDFAEKLLRRLDEHRIPPELIEIEVTEHILLERGAEFVGNALRILKSHGVRISLDDFGTGHSSFAHLRDYPVDNVKIDRSFVNRMVDEPTILAIVEAISRLGPALAIDVIAEGIETERQREILVSAECRFGQGFLFGRAMPAAAAAERLAALDNAGWAPGQPPMQVARGRSALAGDVALPARRGRR